MSSEQDPARLVADLAAAGMTLAVAESLTAGLVCARIADVPGASRVFRGGAVVYAIDTKASVLGVDDELLSSRGAVDPAVAAAMARGVRLRFSADLGVATTGVAGPGPADGKDAGTVYVAATAPWLTGDEVSFSGTLGAAPSSGTSLRIGEVGERLDVTDGALVWGLQVPGDRAAVREKTVAAALAAARVLLGWQGPVRRRTQGEHGVSPQR